MVCPPELPDVMGRRPLGLRRHEQARDKRRLAAITGRDTRPRDLTGAESAWHAI
jgi:hypothetical protein